MICNKCGTDVPDYCKFCIRCGNRLRPDEPVQPSAPAAPVQPASAQPTPPTPPPASANNPFGAKQISGRHYSLEDIARQQEESSNAIGLAPAPTKKSKKRRREAEPALPSREPDTAQNQPAAPTNANMNPLLQPIEEVVKAPRQQGKPIKHSKTIPQAPAASANPLLKPFAELTGKPAPSAPPTSAAPQHQTTPPAVSPTQSPTASTAQNPTTPPAQIPQETVCRYTIATPPVPCGLQMQTNLPLFSGDIRPQTESLRQEYTARTQPPVPPQ